MKLSIVKSTLLLSLAATLALSSCSKPEPIVVYGLTLSQQSVVFDAEGGAKLLSVAPFPEDEAWNLEIVQQPDWATIESVAEGVEVSVVANTASTIRSASFRLVSPEGRFEPYEVAISQEGAKELSWSTSAASSYAFDSEGGQISFVVVANDEWSVESSAEWLSVECDKADSKVVVVAAPNREEEPLSATLRLVVGSGEQQESLDIEVVQDIRANNPYYKLVGKWEIMATKWFYSPNGSLNSLDYAPNPSDYFLIFDIEEGVYGQTLLMKDFLYPGTELEVRYDSATGGMVIPFGWTVLSYNVFFYITLVSDRQFSYAAYEVAALPEEDGGVIALDMPTVSGFNYVGFGLWTYDENENKVALGSNYRPTMFPMAPITLRKHNDDTTTNL
ncbi:MAG: BACON domain-containing protein [Tidjanibacter sp.]|nr:BACON domain-containing protein [Tidjanibacter sp.]